MKNTTGQKRHQRYRIASDGMHLLYLFLLGGCSSFGNVMSGLGAGQSFDALPTDTSKILTGKTINGYLANALVFQDINSDGFLSGGEPLTITGLDGSFSLASKTGAIVVKPVNHLTTDEKLNATQTLNAAGIYNPDVANTYYINNNGAVVNFSGLLKLASTNGATKVNVTPMTTYVAGLVSSGKYDAQQAEQKAVEMFGVSSQVDYVALSKSTDSQIAAAGIESQNKAVSFSNLITEAVTFFAADVSAEKVLNTLAVHTTESYDAVASYAINTPSWTSMLASKADVKEIFSKIAQENALEIDSIRLDAAMADLATKNQALAPTTILSLTNDSGFSAIDAITSDTKITVDQTFADGQKIIKFADVSGKVDYATVATSLQWVASLNDVTFSEGLNTLFAKDFSTANGAVYNLTFMLDTHAPTVNYVSDPSVYRVTSSQYFQSDGKIYINTPSISSDFLTHYQTGVEKTYLQYQVTTALDGSDFSHPNDEKWFSFLNISSLPNYDGLSYRTYYRAMDVAGNTAGSNYQDVVLDNVAPLVLTADFVEMRSDTGIYSYDRYSQSITLNQISKLVANDYEEQTTTVVYQWTRAGDAAVDAAYATTQKVPANDGNYTLWTKQVDRAGNESETVAFDFVLDTEAPVLPTGTGIDPTAPQNSLSIRPGDAIDSLLEWGQYKISPNGTTPTLISDWSNLNVIEHSGTYDVYYRRVDRAGNASAEQYVGALTIDMTAPSLTLDYTKTFASYTALQNYVLQLTDQQALLGNQLIVNDQTHATQTDTTYLVHEFISARDAVGNVSLPLEISLVVDQTHRTSYDWTQTFAPWVVGPSDTSTLFDLPLDSGDSYNLIGGQGSDRVNNFVAGDVFLGQAGIDYLCYDDSQVVYGMSFLSPQELDFITNSSGLLSGLASNMPTLKVYSENSANPDEGGMSIVQAELLSYKDDSGQSQLLSFDHLQSLNAWVINLGANDDALYFGGDNIYVNGGSGADHLQGGAGADFLIAGSSSAVGIDYLQGYGGNDVLIGGDYQLLSDSKYKLDGGAGSDWLIAGNGHGDLVGGDGADVFLVAPVPGALAPIYISITDFNPTDDKIAFLNWHLEDSYKGVFVDAQTGNVQIDLTELLGAPYGSVLTVSGPDINSLLPETVIEHWFTSQSATDFAWSDLGIDVLTNL